MILVILVDLFILVDLTNLVMILVNLLILVYLVNQVNVVWSKSSFCGEKVECDDRM